MIGSSLRRWGLVCALALGSAAIGSPALAAPSTVGDSPSGAASADITGAVKHDLSPPLRDLPPRAPSSTRQAIPLRSTGSSKSRVFDPVVQTSASTPLGATAGLNFLGLGIDFPGFAMQGEPSDSNGAVGATQFVEWVNLQFAVFSKTNGALLLGPVAGNTLWTGFGGPCEANNDGDPIAQYDKAANRWVLTQFAVTGGPPFYQCVAVSTTSDATGTFNRYAFQEPNFPDYPKVGVWPDAYYISFNMFTHRFLGSRACALERAAMLAGTAARQVCFQQGSSVPSLLPSDLDGATAPPTGSPNFFLNFGSSALNLFKFHVDWANPLNSTFTGPTVIPVAAFSPACGGGACVPQPNTTQLLDSLGDRLMYRLAYRNFGTREALVVNHSVNPNNNTAGVRWYEIDHPNGTPIVAQQSTYAVDANFRWMGSVAMDKMGDLAVGYSLSSSGTFPSIRISGRAASDPPGALRAETSVVTGTGSQAGHNRWGDYSSMSIDPVDDCTFWYTQQFINTPGVNDFIWSTQVASFKFPNCL